jgi:hypothetical protein
VEVVVCDHGKPALANLHFDEFGEDREGFGVGLLVEAIDLDVLLG